MHARQLASNRLLQLIFAGIMLTLVLAAVWKFTPLRQAVDVAGAVGWVEEFSEQWWAPFAILLAFTPASFIMFPRQAISVAAAP